MNIQEKHVRIYDREVEWLKRIVGRYIVVLTGMRRIGETSVLKTLNKYMFPYALLMWSHPSDLIDLYTIFPNV